MSTEQPASEAGNLTANRVPPSDWLASLHRLRRIVQNRPGGGRLDEYSQGYDKAMAEFGTALRKEIALANAQGVP